MRKILSAILSSTLALMMVSSSLPYASAQNRMVLLWSNPMAVNDLAVSKDGNYIAVVNDTHVCYFASGSSSPRWWYEASPTEAFIFVAISGDGDYVAVFNSTDSMGDALYYFANAKARLGEQTASTWQSSTGLWSLALDMSDDGDYIVVATPHEALYYGGCTQRSGPGQTPSWDLRDLLGGPIRDIYDVDMSSDGRYVVVGGMWLDYITPFLAFVEDANTVSPTVVWYLWEGFSLFRSIADVAVSDDGYAVAALEGMMWPSGKLHYWADATNLQAGPDKPPPDWTRRLAFGCMDMSSDGDEVVAGAPWSVPCGIHFWAGARGLEGVDVPETWTRHEGEGILDVAISDDGGIIAATTNTGPPSKVYFYTSGGNLIGEYDLPILCDVVSMSGDGGIVAVGGPSVDSIYVFAIRGPVGGELVSTPILNPMVLAAAMALASAAALGYRLKKR